MVEISEDLRDLVASTISSIKEGLKEDKCGVSGTIKFEVSVVKSKEGKTGLRLVVADASGKFTKDNISKISFEVAGVITESEKEDLQNKISQIGGKLNLSNSKVAQLNKEIQTLNNTINDQKSTIEKDNEEIAELRNQNNQFAQKLSNTETQRDKALRQNRELAQQNKKLNDELSKNPKVIVK